MKPLLRRTAKEAGFTLIEVLLATLLMTVILGALCYLDGAMVAELEQGHGSRQRAERLALGLNRILADLSVAEMVPHNSESKAPFSRKCRSPSCGRQSVPICAPASRSFVSAKRPTSRVWPWSVNVRVLCPAE